MKKTVLAFTMALAAISAKSQTVDTVSIGAGYASQVWYSLANGEQGSAPKNNWDLAFDCSGMGATILINSAAGTTLWKYPQADTSGWSSVDTAGVSSWSKCYNSDTSWAMGAMGRYADPSNPFDLDWGQYSMITHFVTGDSLYVIKLANGQYKKLWMIQLANSAYSFRYADLNGANLQNATVNKTSYASKNLVYYSLSGNTLLDREPASAAWDLLFTQYTAFIPGAYTVTGLLQNNNVRVAKVAHHAHPETYNNWFSQSYSSNSNVIGYDWKTFNGSAYAVNDSLLYFVKTNAGDVWKLVFTGFGGSADGNYIFSKEKISAVGIKEENKNTIATLAVYPNPSNGENTTVIYNFDREVSKANLSVSDLNGRIISSESLNASIGLHTGNLNTISLSAGVYIISMTADGKSVQQKLIIQ